MAKGPSDGLPFSHQRHVRALLLYIVSFWCFACYSSSSEEVASSPARARVCLLITPPTVTCKAPGSPLCFGAGWLRPDSLCYLMFLAFRCHPAALGSDWNEASAPIAEATCEERTGTASFVHWACRWVSSPAMERPARCEGPQWYSSTACDQAAVCIDTPRALPKSDTAAAAAAAPAARTIFSPQSLANVLYLTPTGQKHQQSAARKPRVHTLTFLDHLLRSKQTHSAQPRHALSLYKCRWCEDGANACASQTGLPAP